MIRRLVTTCLLLLFAASAVAQETSRAPEAATGTTAKALAVAQKHMVAAAHPLAVEAGRDILRSGGSAIDAAIATQLVLGLVEPQSSGLGGGAFIVTWDAAAKAVKTYDGRETAPAAAKHDRFMRDGKTMDFDAAVRSGLSVGVPGVVAAMELAHKAHGKLPWARLFEPAIKLAEQGFPVPARLNMLLRWRGAKNFDAGARAFFFEKTGTARAVGSTLKNPDYAVTLREIAAGGAPAFYSGRIADAILNAVAQAPNAKGDMTRDDLAGYRAKERTALCFSYRTRKICGMGPPSSGAMTVAQTLKLIEPFADVQGAAAMMSGPALHTIAEAEKLAYADRDTISPTQILVPCRTGCSMRPILRSGAS